MSWSGSIGFAGDLPLTGTRVLLVEDNTDIRDVFALLLRSDGADVTAVTTGQEALDRMLESRFDVLVTDLGLPDISGLALIEAVTSAPRQHPRIIVVTGYDEPYLSEARRAGADAVFTKPVAWPRLRALVAAGDRTSAVAA